MRLEEQQALLAEAIRGEKLTLSSGLEAATIAAGNGRLSPIEMVDIYREQYWLRHRDCLREDFASVEHAMGEDAFEALIKAYLAKHPSPSFTLRDLGKALATYLEEYPFLADLARVEWAFIEAFDGPDAAPFDPASIAGRSEDEWPLATLLFHPSLQRLRLTHAAHNYRIAVRKDESTTPTRDDRACDVVIYRGPSMLHCHELDAPASALLDELMRGAPLGSACERAAMASSIELEAFQARLATWFSEWTAMGWIRAVVFP